VFLITADRAPIDNPRHYRRAERALRRAQGRVARRTKGSHRRRQAVAQLKRHHQTVQRQRRDVHHKTARALLQQYDVVYVEELQVRNMVRNPHLAKSISDAGWAAWAAFRTILTCKAVDAGKWVIAVPAHYTSQDGSGMLGMLGVLGMVGVLGVLTNGSRCTRGSPRACRCAPTSVRPVGWCSTVMKTRRRAFCGPGRPVRRQRGPRGPLGRASPERPPA